MFNRMHISIVLPVFCKLEAIKTHEQKQIKIHNDCDTHLHSRIRIQARTIAFRWKIKGNDLVLFA